MEWTIRQAIPSDAVFLTSISFGAKRYWGDTEGYLEMSQNQLTITEAYIRENIVLVAEKEGTILGYCSVIEIKRAYWKGKTFIKAGYWLEHLFMRPAYMESSMGIHLIEAVHLYCKTHHISHLNVISYSRTNSFFEQIGANYVKQLRSDIDGRKMYLFELIVIEEEVVKSEEVSATLDFNKQTFEKEMNDLENKRIYLEKQVLEHKLYELDKDIDEDEDEDTDQDFYISGENLQDKIYDSEEEVEDKSYEYQEELEEDVYTSIDHLSIKEMPIQEIAEAAAIYSVDTEVGEAQNIEPYIPWGDQVVADRNRARRILREFNRTNPENKKQTTALLKQLFGSIGESIYIEPDFKCNFGYNIDIGNNFYADYNCVILDNAKVTIGENCIISPQVGIYTLAYPISAKQRMAGYEYAQPITIGNHVWIGGGTVIYPGVTIGNNVVIRPGSVVSLDIPDGVIAGGNPARGLEVIKE